MGIKSGRTNLLIGTITRNDGPGVNATTGGTVYGCYCPGAQNAALAK